MPRIPGGLGELWLKGGSIRPKSSLNRPAQARDRGDGLGYGPPFLESVAIQHPGEESESPDNLTRTYSDGETPESPLVTMTGALKGALQKA